MTVIDATETQTEAEIHARALRLLKEAGIPYVLAGAFALRYYTGISRHTKDIDLFLLRPDVPRALHVLAGAGYATQVLARHWLANACQGEYVVDLIHGFGGWRAAVDRGWFERAVPTQVYGVPVLVAPVEELTWMKAYVAHRERFDGADVLHLLQARRSHLDWPHLVARFGECWEVLLYYLLLYKFVYPSDRSTVPHWVMDTLLARLRTESGLPNDGQKVCRGTLLDRFSYVVDVEERGYGDGRLQHAVAQGYSARDLAEDRREASRMAREGRVRPGRVT